MARRIAAPASTGTAIPEQIAVRLADWTQPGDEHLLEPALGPRLSTLVAAHHRHATARRQWATNHGVSLRTLGDALRAGQHTIPN